MSNLKSIPAEEDIEKKLKVDSEEKYDDLHVRLKNISSLNTQKMRMEMMLIFSIFPFFPGILSIFIYEFLQIGGVLPFSILWITMSFIAFYFRKSAIEQLDNIVHPILHERKFYTFYDTYLAINESKSTGKLPNKDLLYFLTRRITDLQDEISTYQIYGGVFDSEKMKQLSNMLELADEKISISTLKPEHIDSLSKSILYLSAIFLYQNVETWTDKISRTLETLPDPDKEESLPLYKKITLKTFLSENQPIKCASYALVAGTISFIIGCVILRLTVASIEQEYYLWIIGFAIAIGIGVGMFFKDTEQISQSETDKDSK